MSVAPVMKRPIRIGPRHHGMRMSLVAFAHSDSEPGYLYELEKGVVVVVDVPGVPHFLVVERIRERLFAYKAAHRTVFHVGGGADSVLRMPQLVSERHPDLAVYLDPPPSDDEQAWDEWTPDIVVEVVSKTSRKRDYEIKAGEYLAAGARAYWIIDPLTRSATVLSRRGDTWRLKKLGARGAIPTAPLPGFELRLSDVFSVLGRR